MEKLIQNQCIQFYRNIFNQMLQKNLQLVTQSSNKNLINAYQALCNFKSHINAYLVQKFKYQSLSVIQLPLIQKQDKLEVKLVGNTNQKIQQKNIQLNPSFNKCETLKINCLFDSKLANLNNKSKDDKTNNNLFVPKVEATGLFGAGPYQSIQVQLKPSIGSLFQTTSSFPKGPLFQDKDAQQPKNSYLNIGSNDNNNSNISEQSEMSNSNKIGFLFPNLFGLKQNINNSNVYQKQVSLPNPTPISAAPSASLFLNTTAPLDFNPNKQQQDQPPIGQDQVQCNGFLTDTQQFGNKRMLYQSIGRYSSEKLTPQLRQIFLAIIRINYFFELNESGPLQTVLNFFEQLCEIIKEGEGKQEDQNDLLANLGKKILDFMTEDKIQDIQKISTLYEQGTIFEDQPKKMMLQYMRFIIKTVEFHC